MDEKRYEQVKALVSALDEAWGCGPYEECVPDGEQLQKLNQLTGRTWEAEDVRELCFEYFSHNSLEETAYFLFNGDYPPVSDVDLVFWRPKPGAVLEARTVYEKYRLGGQMKALEPLPKTSITAALRSVPGFQKHSWASPGSEPDDHSLRMDCLDQPDQWSDVHFWAFWYGGRRNPEPDHMLCLSCHNMTKDQLQVLMDLLAGFGAPLQYRQEGHDA